jgi:amino acid transporter
MRKIVLTFGFIAGGILAAMMLISMVFQDEIGFDRALVVGYTSMVLAFLMVYFGVRSYRDNLPDRAVSFGRAFKVGLLITLVATVCYVATWELVYFKLSPDFSEKYAAYEVQKARDSGASEAKIAASVEKMKQFKEMYRNPLVNIAFTFIEPLPVGLVFTLVTAGVLSRRRNGRDMGQSIPLSHEGR